MTDQTISTIQYLKQGTLVDYQIVNANCRHLRVTIDEKQQSEFVDNFIAKFHSAIKMYVFSSEVSDKGVHHIHGHIEWKDDKIPKKQSFSDWFKKQKLSGKYYHQQLDKPPINNLLYVTKDLKILSYEANDHEFVEHLKEQTEKINEDKKASSRHKLLQLFKEHLIKTLKEREEKVYKMEDPMELREILRPWFVVQFIHETYTKLWDKPPHLASMKQTALYIMQKVTDDDKINISYQDTINTFYEKFMGLF